VQFIHPPPPLGLSTLKELLNDIDAVDLVSLRASSASAADLSEGHEL
jgi:hypothetical protein